MQSVLFKGCDVQWTQSVRKKQNKHTHTHRHTKQQLQCTPPPIPPKVFGKMLPESYGTKVKRLSRKALSKYPGGGLGSKIRAADTIAGNLLLVWGGHVEGTR